MTSPIYDFIGIGLGPFNLSLACLSEPIEALNTLFIEQKPAFDWHPGLMLESAHLQTPFMSDLVTLADPTSPYSFLNYIKQQGRMYSFYIREDFYLLRREYNQYCQWAAEKLTNTAFSQRVINSDYLEDQSLYQLTLKHTVSGELSTLLTRRLVLGTGPSPYIPECCPSDNQHISHASDYLPNKADLQQQQSITIVGSGQSAAEIYYDLLTDIDTYGYQLNWLTRAPRYFPLEYTKLTLEMTSPEYIDYFHALPQAKRDQLNQQQKQLYKGINADLINDIYDLLYNKRLTGDCQTLLMCNARLSKVSNDNGQLGLTFNQHEQQQDFRINSQRLILATGYQYVLPEFLNGISGQLNWTKQGQFEVQRNYSIDRNNAVFVQNAEIHSHGFTAPDLGMACYRNSYILAEILGYQPYTIEQRIGFQQFGLPLPKTINSDQTCATSITAP
jgi:lysine N6-hydroxylase